VILVDTSGLLAALDAGERHHAATVAALRGAPGPLLLSPFVLAELDYLIRRRVSAAAADALLRQVGTGALRLEVMGPGDVGAATRVMERYADLDIGLTDASIVVLAHRYGVHDVLTLDERHFRALLGPADRPFRVLPADAA
jgi:predicted nucleic acid-binding protein